MSGNGPLLSPQWFRVAALRPQLDAAAQVQRVVYRRQVWQVVAAADGGRHVRLNAAAWAFVGRCDGRLSMQRLWELLLADAKDDAPTQDELLQLLARLHAAKLLGFDRPPDFGPQPVTRQPVADARQRPASSLLSFRLPLGRPDVWLGRLAARTRWLFTPAALFVWLAVVAGGALAAALNAGLLAAHARTWMGTPRMLTLVWLAYPVVKALHELAHALVIKHFGARVPEWGVTLMVFTPVPYVDASAATLLAGRGQRVLVSAAGIMLELFLAALALGVGLNAEPGWLRDLALAVFFIGSVSTLLVNGNPLLRFDGYHVLTDALELPNLATRSAQHWAAWLRSRLLRAPLPPATVADRGEQAWLWAYAPAALATRWAVSLGIVGWLGGVSWPLGVAVALLLGWGLVVQPLRGGWRWLHGLALADAERLRVQRRALVAGSVALLVVAVLPLPFSTVAEGVVWLPEQALVRADTDGFIASVDATDGTAVATGQRLFTLDAPSLVAEQTALQQRITALDTERIQTMRGDPARAVALDHELARVAANLARADERIAQLGVAAASAGNAVIDHADDLPGRFVKQGALLGHVLAPGPSRVRVAIPQEQAALVQGATHSVSVRLAAADASAWPGELLGERSGERSGDRSGGAAGTVRRLPSAALGDRSGGSIVTDPKDKLLPAHGVVLADVQLAVDLGPVAGARAWVRFDHGAAPLAWQAARRLQQLFLRHFNPSQ